MGQKQMVKLSTKDMKKIVHEVVEKEKRANHLEIDAFPVTLIEYYNKHLFSGNFSLNRVSEYIQYPINAMGFHNDGKIFIFLNKIKKIMKMDSSMAIFELLDTIYHELRHCMQENNSNLSYEKFLCSLEGYLRLGTVKELNYEDNHDAFSYEIGAQLYGLSKAKHYLMEKYPEIYEEIKEYIDKLEKRYMFNYYMYDASHVVDLAVPVIRSELKKGSISGDSILMNSNGSFKSISCLLENPVFVKLDKRMISAIMSSRTFLSELNFEELSMKELTALKDAVNYTKTVYKNQLQYLEKALNDRVVSDKVYLSKREVILKKLSELEIYIEKIEFYMSIAKIVDGKKK